MLLTHALCHIDTGLYDEKILKLFEECNIFFIEPSLYHSRVDCIFIRNDVIVNKELLDKYSGLKYIVSLSSGNDNINLCECSKKNICTIFPDNSLSANAVAELTLYHMLNSLRDVSQNIHEMDCGRFNKYKYIGLELKKQTVGIIGCGAIGSCVIEKCEPLCKYIMYYDINNDINCSRAHKCESLEQLFSDCDIVSIHVPLTDKTRDMIDDKLLSLLKEKSILINMSRAEIINKCSLITERFFEPLQKRLTFCSDTIYNEPKYGEDDENFIPKRYIFKTYITSHIGARTASSQYGILHDVLQQLYSEMFLL